MSDEKTVGEAANRLVDGIEALAKATEKVAPQAWEAMVSAHRAYAITEVVVWVLVVIAASVSFRMARKEAAKDHESPMFIILTIVCGMLFATALLMATIGGPSTVNHIISPEYYAAMDLLSRVSK